MKKYFKRYQKDTMIEYIDYLKSILDQLITEYYSNKRNMFFELIELKEQIKKISNKLYWNDKKTISYFTFSKINKIAEKIDFLSKK